MFGRLLDVESWEVFVRGTLVRLAMLLLAPSAVITLSLLAFFLFPVACVGIPFLVPAFFGGASTEHEAAGGFHLALGHHHAHSHAM